MNLGTLNIQLLELLSLGLPWNNTFFQKKVVLLGRAPHITVQKYTKSGEMHVVINFLRNFYPYTVLN